MKLTLLFFVFGVVAAMGATPALPDATVNDFFQYLLSGKHDILKDSTAQNRWLTKDVRQTVAAADAGATKAAKAHPGEQIDGVDNGTFIAAWDPPTSFKITKVEAKSASATARVNLLYTWGPKTQYPGETRAMTVLLAMEDGAWKVSDIQSHKSKFSPESTLLGDLRHVAKQH
ncbi:MAG: hypothetical protein P4L99_20640 [Chthoniobacter sp.]|nr:hypothetical protein [Chthoniobacter sp.]